MRKKIFEVTCKSHSAEKHKREDPLRFFEHPFCYNKQKMDPLETLKKFAKKSHKAETTCTKKFGQGRDSNLRPCAWQTSKTPN